MATLEYRSPFARRDEDPELHQPLEADRHFFSTDLTPLLSSAEVRERLPAELQRELEVHQLYAYLRFTESLELGPVNEVAGLLRHRNFIPQLPAGRRHDAIYIVRDESKHAQWSHRVMLDVEQFTGIKPLRTEPEFLRELDALMAPEPIEIAQLIRVVFVAVSETLITGSLSRLPEDPSVQESVRSLAAAHARDERTHHAYFFSLFQELWPSMPIMLQVKLGVLLPGMLRAFLAPDRAYLTSVLDRYPQYFDQPARTVGELIDSEATTSSMISTAGASIEMFRRAGVFEHAAVRSEFERDGFGEVI